MKKTIALPPTLPYLLVITACIFMSSIQIVSGQTYMFDDFNYSGVNDAQLAAFNKWSIVQGRSGPPEGGIYSKDNITFITDPASTDNKLMTLSTTVNGATKATTHSRLETNGFDYFEGTYAARVYFAETPFTYRDANIQTFYTIVASSLGANGAKYSELDFEYMASDQWGIAANKQVMYMTAWNRYIPEPWQAWKNYFASQKSWEGWHTCVVSCTNKKDVKFFIDGVSYGSMSVTDNDGTSVYPRSPMQVAFANWIWNEQVGNSTTSRTTTMQVDWVLFCKDTEKTPAEVNALVAGYRNTGLRRHNLAGQDFIDKTTDLKATLFNTKAIEVFPNPSADGVFQLSALVPSAVVRNLQGETVALFTNTNMLDLSYLPSGMYFAQVGIDTYKIIKK